jgi:hypothetical protein
MHTLASAAVCDRRVLTVTGNLVPPPGSRFAPVQPWPAGGSANCTRPAVLSWLALPPPPVLLVLVLVGCPGLLVPAELPAVPVPVPLPVQEASPATAASTAQQAASRQSGCRPCIVIGSKWGKRQHRNVISP